MAFLCLAIPTMKRWKFLKQNLPVMLERPEVAEIVICDETGEDAKMIQETYKDNEKIKVYVNERVLGAFLNKRKVVSLAKNDIICLMDSDNFAPLSYFEAWVKYIKENGLKDNTVYCPSRTKPQFNHQGFDYRPFIGLYDFDKCKKNFHNITFVTMLNTGNYIINKNIFISSTPNESQRDLEISCKAFDVLFRNYILLTKGNMILAIVPDMEYDHIVHDGSYYTETQKEINTDKFFNLFK
jgi:hypothetical protein